MILTFLELGFRLGEMKSLCIEDLDFNKHNILVRREKVSKTQTHRLSIKLRALLLDYLVYCENEKFGPLFISYSVIKEYRGSALSSSGIEGIITKYGEKIGYPTLSPHDLRHTWATILGKSDISLKALMVAGGWNSYAMPLHYMKADDIANESIVVNYFDQTESN